MCENITLWLRQAQKEKYSFFAVHVYMCAQLCLTPCSSLDCSLLGSFIYGISQARILEWVAISRCRVSSGHRDQTGVTCVPCTGREILQDCDTWEAQLLHTVKLKTLGEDM